VFVPEQVGDFFAKCFEDIDLSAIDTANHPNVFVASIDMDGWITATWANSRITAILLTHIAPFAEPRRNPV
jgi:hypothetical protein